ncbi:hypothetical protein MFRU_002g00970 [Monilinia fructicola]|uniref:Uncharacterized protein n=1 Tax=Monilinia fructicola TaxID=38448 RepID=A0A5M9K3R5_MONFR|nr:hypothetical protein EYC84_004583 [Monilinia fructicola]KAG4034744.1 hypothetical protein MFRU_002g00970 [Monilinia fructicola]
MPTGRTGTNGKSGTRHHCPGKKTGPGNCRMDGTGKCSKIKYCVAHQTICPDCVVSSRVDYTFLRVSDKCPQCGWKHDDHKDKVKERQIEDKNAQTKAAQARVEEGKAKVAAQKAAAAARKR